MLSPFYASTSDCSDLHLWESWFDFLFVSFQLMVSALRCAAFYLMWAKVNAVNSTPAEVLVYALLSSFFGCLEIV